MSQADVSFAITPAESKLIGALAHRAKGMAERGDKYTLTEWRMDITACHANGMPLRLAELCKADDFNFVHDVYGIRRHLDRDTGHLLNCFVPRYAAPSKREAA